MEKKPQMGAWRGSSNTRVEDLSGMEELERAMKKKRIRWTASVYGRHLPILKPIVQPILEELFDTENAIFHWIGDPIIQECRKEVEETELATEEVQKYSNRSRRDGAAAGANTADVEYLGRYATIMDTEL